MADGPAEGNPSSRSSGIAAELAAAGFTDAVEVGRGGGGVVFRCHQRSLGRSVAIKVLASDLDDDDRERFLREGYAMGALSGHPHIANILQEWGKSATAEQLAELTRWRDQRLAALAAHKKEQKPA